MKESIKTIVIRDIPIGSIFSYNDRLYLRIDQILARNAYNSPMYAISLLGNEYWLNGDSTIVDTILPPGTEFIIK